MPNPQQATAMDRKPNEQERVDFTNIGPYGTEEPKKFLLKKIGEYEQKCQDEKTLFCRACAWNYFLHKIEEIVLHNNELEAQNMKPNWNGEEIINMEDMKKFKGEDYFKFVKERKQIETEDTMSGKRKTITINREFKCKKLNHNSSLAYDEDQYNTFKESTKKK